MITPGENITVTGAGFQPYETVALTIQTGAESSSIFAGVVATDRGTFEASSKKGLIKRAAKRLQPGLYTIRAVGDQGSKASAPIRVVETLPTPPSEPGVNLVVVGGAEGVEVGSRVTVLGSGFQPKEGVITIIVAATPAGDALLIGGQANSSGAFEFRSRPMSKSIQPGVYTVKATGDKGSIATAILKVVEAKGE